MSIGNDNYLWSLVLIFSLKYVRQHRKLCIVKYIFPSIQRLLYWYFNRVIHQAEHIVLKSSWSVLYLIDSCFLLQVCNIFPVLLDYFPGSYNTFLKNLLEWQGTLWRKPENTKHPWTLTTLGTLLIFSWSRWSRYHVNDSSVIWLLVHFEVHCIVLSLSGMFQWASFWCWQAS